MKWVPKISYGTGPTVVTFTQAQKLWSPSARDIGGSNKSDAGIPEAFIIRRDQLCDVELRFLESEWATVDTWLAYVIQGFSFDFWFNKTDNATKYTVYLESPKVGDDIKPKREPYGKVMSLSLTLRTTAGGRFTTGAF
jgi:hypothetical protein